MCAGALEYEPQHDRQLPEQGGLRIGKHLVLIVRKEEPREAQDDVGDAVDDQPHANEPRQETRLIRQGSHGEEPEPPQDLGGNDLRVMQPEEQQDQCVTLRLVEDGQEVDAARAPAPAPRDHEGAGIAHDVHEVDEGGHHAAHDHEQHRELLVDAFEQPVKRKHEEDQHHGAEQIAQHAEPEEPLVRGDVAGRRGGVVVHEEFVMDVDEAQRAAQYEEQVPESNHSSWIAGPAHVPSVAERVRLQVSGRYATSGGEVSASPRCSALDLVDLAPAVLHQVVVALTDVLELLRVLAAQPGSLHHTLELLQILDL